MSRRGSRIPLLYLAPWVDYGGSDKNTIDWFRWIDRDRFAPHLITTQPSLNRLLSGVAPYSEETWALPDLMPAEDMPAFILDFIHSREVRVLHLMNSRIGFDLLPFLGCLPRPPRVVVQLHVEEEDRSGYVRYVTTRYGNLVDRFSISNRHVADAVEGYGVPRDRIRVIYTGADPDNEFSPERAEPEEDLPSDRLQILFAGRLVPQKDPSLMLDVASALRRRGVDFQIHVVGEGELELQIRDRIEAEGLGDTVILHRPTPGLRGWYAATDSLLMTSSFEGIPCVIFEAMAMGLPIVAPDLPAIAELLDEVEGSLISPRDSVDGYVEALTRLAEDRAYRDGRGRELRERAKQQFTVEQMADAHGELYQELDAAMPPHEAEPETPRPERIRFGPRVEGESPLVSILIPHFNQTRFLGECIDSVRDQTYRDLEVVVVDDASEEEGSDEALQELEADAAITVVRLAENGGPSRARNEGLPHCGGRYILPLDADNKLLPDAVENLVSQLSRAPDDVGFVYPNIQYFGNREEYYEVPEYNLYTLLHGNFCDTCSLLDRAIFDAGERYREEIRLGHEDWEFVLRLAARGVRGEVARRPTVLYRKWGFNRSDLVDYSGEPFEDVLAEISPFRGREAEVKAREAPALSLVAIAALGADGEETRRVATGLSRQSLGDLELLASFEGEWPAESDLPPVRRLDEAPGDGGAAGLRAALATARGSYLALTAGSGAALLENPAVCEMALRRATASGDGNEVDAIALVDAGEGGYPMQALSDPDRIGQRPHTVIWRRTVELDLPQGLQADPGDPIGSIVHLLSGAGLKVEWRNAAGSAGEAPAAGGEAEELPTSREAFEDPYDLRPGAQPLLPAAGAYRVPAWEKVPTWVPAHSTIATRYREIHGPRMITTNGDWPVGFAREYHIGALKSVSFAGTAKLVRIGDRYRMLDPGEAPDGAEDIGYVELFGLPQMDVITLAVHRATGQQILMNLTEDPIHAEADFTEVLGYVDPFPARPRLVPDCSGPPLGLLGLTKAVDLATRRHRYAIGEAPDGEFVEELGALAESSLDRKSVV